MNVIFYSSTIDERTTEICRMLEDPHRDVGLEPHHSISSLESRLRQPLFNTALMLLYLSEKSDLAGMIALRELIIGLPLILIMIDTRGEAMTKAHRLQPRIIFGADDNIDDICLVFEKMLARHSNYWQQQYKSPLKTMKQ
jgi:hypothetical protein